MSSGDPMILFPLMLVSASMSMSAICRGNSKDIYHFEVGIRTQQMLENFIEGNQRQMQHLSDEINRVGNIALNNNQYLRVLKRHSWKGLRKFHSIEKLRDARIYKEYPH